MVDFEYHHDYEVGDIERHNWIDVVIETESGAGDHHICDESIGRFNVTDEAEPDPEPDEAFLVDIDSTNSPVEPGDVLEVTADVESTYEDTVTQDVVLDADGERDSEELKLGAGDTESLTLEWLTEEGDEGSYTATVSSEDDSDSVSVEVGEPEDEPEPAFFSVESVDMADEVTAGDELLVSAEVRNTGEESDTQDVELYVEGGNSVVASERVSLGAGESRSVELSWDVGSDAEGEYDVLVRTDDDSMGQLVYVEALPNLEIEEVRPVQVVFNADVTDDNTLDLVEDKETAVLIYPEGENLDKLDEYVEIEVTGPWSTIYKEVTPDEYRDAVGGGDEDYLKVTESPTEVQSSQVRVTADPNNVIDEKSRGLNTKEVAVNVVETQEIGLSYFSVTRPRAGESPNPNHYEDHQEESDKRIKATYPVAGDRYESSDGGEHGSEELYHLSMSGIRFDLLFLEWHTVLRGSDRGIGVVDFDYYGAHDVNHQGTTVPGAISALVVQGNWYTTAHELGHTYGLYQVKEQYDLPDEDSHGGYWVEGNEMVSDDTLTFMQDSNVVFPSVTARWIGNEVQPNNREFGMQDYNHLFGELKEEIQLEVARQEEVLYASAILHQNGSVSDVEMRVTNYDTEFPREQGDGFGIEGFNAEGVKVSGTSFDAPFKMFPGPQDTNISHFVVSQEYAQDLVHIKLTNEEEELVHELNPSSELLHTAVEYVPEHGFDKPELHNQRRNTLHNKIHALENQVDAGNYKGAVQKLRNDITPAFNRWLKDGYEVETNLEMQKQEVLDTAEAVETRLMAQMEPEKVMKICEGPENPGKAIGLEDRPCVPHEDHPGRGIGPEGEPPGHGGEVPGNGMSGSGESSEAGGSGTSSRGNSGGGDSSDSSGHSSSSRDE